MKIYCDGGARGNPGPAASAFVVYGESGKVLYKESRFLGESTNNVAEYRALLMALEWLQQNAGDRVEIILDSELVKKQMTGEYRIKNSALQTLASRAKILERGLPVGVVYKHTSREANPEADRLVNKALDDALK